MPKLSVPLTELQLKRARPGQKILKLVDGGGLYLEVQPGGAKTWRFRFRQTSGKENMLTFGPYPEVGLLEARERRTAARRLLREGIDPAKHRDEARRASADREVNTSNSWRSSGTQTS